MKCWRSICWGFSAFGAWAAQAQLEVLPAGAPARVFAGAERAITVVWRNPGHQLADVELRARILQAGAATAMPVGEAPWKRLRVLPGQTVIESAALSFPTVKAETRFLVQWIAGASNVAGVTDVLVYPPELLNELKPLLREAPLGIFDPGNQLKPLLKAATVNFIDLEISGLATFSGKLAVVGPFQSQEQMRDGLAGHIKALAGKGAAVVWILPPPEPRDGFKPLVYTVPEGYGVVVVAQAELMPNLAANPQSQLNLLQLARLALSPQPPALPFLARQP